MKNIKTWNQFNEGLLYHYNVDNVRIIGENGVGLTIQWLEDLCDPKQLSKKIYEKYGSKVLYQLNIKITKTNVTIYTLEKIKDGYQEKIIDSMSFEDFKNKFID